MTQFSIHFSPAATLVFCTSFPASPSQAPRRPEESTTSAYESKYLITCTRRVRDVCWWLPSQIPSVLPCKGSIVAGCRFSAWVCSPFPRGHSSAYPTGFGLDAGPSQEAVPRPGAMLIRAAREKPAHYRAFGMRNCTGVATTPCLPLPRGGCDYFNLTLLSQDIQEKTFDLLILAVIVSHNGINDSI